MANRLLPFLLFTVFCSFAQRSTFRISGSVKDADEPSIRLYGFFVSVYFNDSLSHETKCDSTGAFSFELPTPQARDISIRLQPRQDKVEMLRDFPTIKGCQNFLVPSSYFTNEIRVITRPVVDRDYIVNFALEKQLIDFSVPSIRFKKNSASTKEGANKSSDSGFNYLLCLMKKTPSLVIELQGRSWDEAFPRRLSRLRAKQIKKQLVSAGINKERIKISAEGQGHPIFTQDQILKEENPIKKADMVESNRTLSYVIVSFNFGTSI